MFGFGRKRSGDGSKDYSEGKRAYDHKEYKSAFKSFLRAAEAGHVEAMYATGMMYHDGLGTTENRSKAVEWWGRAADRGNFRAQYNLGLAYHLGEGVKRNDDYAYNLVLTSAEAGYPLAQYTVGTFCMNGYGAKKSESEAFKWFLKGLTLKNITRRKIQ